jgi:transcriptional regulator with XRE-family HTH domain
METDPSPKGSMTDRERGRPSPDPEKAERTSWLIERIVSVYGLQSNYIFSMPNTTYSPQTVEAARLLGQRVQLGRRERRWTMQELAERVGVSVPTMRKIERGDPSVRLGIAFEAARVTGVPLFDTDPSRLSLEQARVEDRLAVLPHLVRKPAEIDDDF